MISSMTGFGRSQADQEGKQLTVEIKSVNSRYCDIHVRMPRLLDEFEPLLREELTKKLKRGKIEVLISYKDETESGQEVRLNKALALGYKEAIEELGALIEQPVYSQVRDLMNFRDLFVLEEAKLNHNIAPLLISTLQEAADKLNYHRRKEGANLSEALLEQLSSVQVYVAEIEKHSPLVREQYFRRLHQKLSDTIHQYHLQQFTDDRLLAELVVFSDKTDVTEEIIRLKNHLKLFEEALLWENTEETEEAYQVGKRLDFIVQEMNREVNTIGSKANQSQITQWVIDLKCEIEKMREQIQNIL